MGTLLFYEGKLNKLEYGISFINILCAVQYVMLVVHSFHVFKMYIKMFFYAIRVLNTTIKYISMGSSLPAP